MKIEIYNAQSIESFPWHEIESGEKLKPLFMSLIVEKSEEFVKNSCNKHYVLRINQFVFLITESTSSAPQNYLSSIVNQFLGYSKEEVLKGEKFPEHTKQLFNFMYPFLKNIYVGFGSESAVFIHNLYFATCLYTEMELDYKKLTAFLKAYFPKIALVFRSINQRTDAKWFDGLEAQDFKPIAARQVYIMDPKTSSFKKKRPFVMDEKLGQKSEHLEWIKIEKWTKANLSKTCQFYDDLYIKKHSSFNPIYTEKFLEKLTESNLLDFYVLQTKTDKELAAVQAVYETENVMVTPFIGYDFSAPKEWGLYRLMSLQLIQIAEQKGKILNMSSGASDFKKQRGGEPEIDYLMVYAKHLSLRKRMFWKLMQSVSKKITIPAFEKFGV